MRGSAPLGKAHPPTATACHAHAAWSRHEKCHLQTRAPARSRQPGPPPCRPRAARRWPLLGSAPASGGPPARAAAGATQRGAIAPPGASHRCSGRSHGASACAARLGSPFTNRADHAPCLRRRLTPLPQCAPSRRAVAVPASRVTAGAAAGSKPSRPSSHHPACPPQRLHSACRPGSRPSLGLCPRPRPSPPGRLGGNNSQARGPRLWNGRDVPQIPMGSRRDLCFALPCEVHISITDGRQWIHWRNDSQP